MKYIISIILMVCFVSLFCAVETSAQRGMRWRGGWGGGHSCCRMYNPETAEKISGEVVSVDEIIRGKEGFYGIHLTLH